MTAYNDEELYKYIRELGVVDREKLDQALETSKKESTPLADVILQMDLIADDDLGRAISELIKIPYVNLSSQAIADNVLQIIPESVAKKQLIVAFAKDDKNLKVAMYDPSNIELLDFLAKKSGLPTKVYFSTKTNINKALGFYKKDLKQTFDSLLTEKVVTAKTAGFDQAPVKELVEILIDYAFNNRASDIHIEPEKDKSVVRFRIDGVLHDVLDIPLSLHSEVVSRIKVMSKLKTDEHMSAQDGKAQKDVEGNSLDIRVSVVPITHGEKVVMRLLASNSKQLALFDLGMKEKDLNLVKDAVGKPFGMLLSTGPTGSGKTTSIYAVLKMINNRGINIATIEDPVEYEIDGINQIQVNTKTNLTFANGLRSILRQDPNVIFVGEIRDEETAQIAVNSATTGHMVLSTLHTNDAATAVLRLLDMKIEPYLVASTVNAIIGQRLVRRICNTCRFSLEMTREELEKKIDPKVVKKQFGSLEKVRIYQGKGCDACHKTGYSQRVGIFEVLIVSAEIRDLITKGATSEQIKETAVSLGMTTMLEDGLEKVQQGITTIEEITRVTKE